MEKRGSETRKRSATIETRPPPSSSFSFSFGPSATPNVLKPRPSRSHQSLKAPGLVVPPSPSPSPRPRPHPRHPSAVPAAAKTSRTASAPLSDGNLSAKLRAGGGGQPVTHLSRRVASGDVNGGDRRAGSVLVQLRDGQSVRGLNDETMAVLPHHPATSGMPCVLHCTRPLPIPDLVPSSRSLPSPRNSPTYLSPHLRPTPLGAQCSPNQPPNASAKSQSFTDSFLDTLAPVDGTRSRSTSPANSVGSALSSGDGARQPRSRDNRSRNPSSSSTQEHAVKKDDKRRRRGSKQPAPVELDGLSRPERPELHSYTSFEHTFNLHPPPSPPPSPKPVSEGKSWWKIGA